MQMQLFDITLEKNVGNIKTLTNKLLVNKAEIRRFKIKRSNFGGKMYVKSDFNWQDLGLIKN